MQTFYYLSTPYSHDDPSVQEERYILAAEVLRWYLNRGHLAFSPIASSHTLDVRGIRPQQGWLEWDIALLNTLDPSHLTVVVVKLDGWRESVGVQAEIDWATERMVRIEYVDWDYIEENVTLDYAVPSDA